MGNGLRYYISFLGNPDTLAIECWWGHFVYSAAGVQHISDSKCDGRGADGRTIGSSIIDQRPKCEVREVRWTFLMNLHAIDFHRGLLCHPKWLRQDMLYAKRGPVVMQ